MEFVVENEISPKMSSFTNTIGILHKYHKNTISYL